MKFNAKEITKLALVAAIYVVVHWRFLPCLLAGWEVFRCG